KKIGIAHPHWGGPPFGIEEALLAEFKGVDAIVFGHTHEADKRMMNGVLVLNPGQAYASWGVQATVGLLTIGEGKLEGEIRVIKQG
ncbi:MAG: metallophosphoesterase family protein, partial [Dehalococcoidia bacterium]|nr:metallophosphoesterase family protein [Dehalococcoidia bacterium]